MDAESELPRYDTISYSTAGMEDHFISATTCGELLRRAARWWPDSELAFPGERISYFELNRRADEGARCLLAAGARPGDNIGLLSGPSIAMVTAFFAIVKLGATAVMVSDRYKAAELRHVVANSELTLLLIRPHDASGRGADLPALLEEGLPGLDLSKPGEIDIDAAPHLRRVLALGADAGALTSLEAFSDRASDIDDDFVLHLQLAVPLSRIAFIIYTSGTTSMPKGCMLSHEAATRQADLAVHTRYRMDSSSVFWSPIALFHIGGLSQLLSAMTVGATFCHVGRFDPLVALEQIERERCTHIMPGFDITWLPVIDHPDFSNERIGSVRLLLSGGTPDYLRKLERRSPHLTVLSMYGSSEASGNVVVPLLEDTLEDRTDVCGRPLGGMEFKVIDTVTGEDLPAGRQGELLFRGPARLEGYYGDRDVTAMAIDDEGWFHSGDLAVIGDDGLLAFRGREKDMLKVGGENVAAAEIESLLISHPAVNVVAVVAAPDPKYTEVPAAFIEVKRGETITEEELVGFCTGKIASFKVPRYVRIMDPEQWPMSGTKIKKTVLRDMISAALKPET